MNDLATVLGVSGVSKSYSAKVLSGVDLEVRQGEVHALVGENGAGKSTLARIIAGLTQADSGRIWLRGEPFSPRDKADAEDQGVRLVMQELNLISNLSVAENIFLKKLPHRFGWVDYRRLNRQAQELMDTVGLTGIDPRSKVMSLGVGQQQLVEIAAGISARCDLLILDEPTAALTRPEIERLFRQIEQLRAAGTGLIYISHRLEEIQQIAQRITVLRDGMLVATRQVAEISMDEIVRLMVGRDLQEAAPRLKKLEQPVALRVQGLSAGTAVRDVSFEVRQGEVLGFAGLMGSGRTETMRAIFGADPVDAGELYLRDERTPVTVRSPRDAVRLGIAFLTEDRKSQGLFLPLAVRVNATFLTLRRLSWGQAWIRRDAERTETDRWVTALKIRCASVEQRVAELSGGNQQKIVIAKWLLRDCDVLIFDEPTRGIDVGAKFEIYQLLADLAGQGKAIVVVSSDLNELLAICDRVVVMSAGRVAASFGRDEWTQEKIMAAALSGYLGKGLE